MLGGERGEAPIPVLDRIHAAGLWSRQSRAVKRETNVRVAETLLRHVEPACVGYMNAGYVRLCRKALRLALRTGDLRGVADDILVPRRSGNRVVVVNRAFNKAIAKGLGDIKIPMPRLQGADIEQVICVVKPEILY